MDKTGVAIISFTLIQVVLGAWWLPQKGQACTKLYDNVPAQIICFAND